MSDAMAHRKIGQKIDAWLYRDMRALKIAPSVIERLASLLSHHD
jgi:hypothetical protein